MAGLDGGRAADMGEVEALGRFMEPMWGCITLGRAKLRDGHRRLGSFSLTTTR